MSVRHGDRVAVQLQQEACAEEGLRCGSCLPAFQFVRAGLIIDEYHAHADMPYDEELGKRVDAALSLSRPDDSCERRSLPSVVAAAAAAAAAIQTSLYHTLNL